MRSGAATRSCSSTTAAAIARWRELREQFQRRPDVTRVVVLARNAGQHMAILAAFAQTRGDYVITLDADLQNPPEEIARLVAAMDAGADYVGTIRVRRQDVLWRKAASRLMNRMREGTTSIRITDQGCMLRGYHRSVIDAVNHCTEVSTYVPALAYTFARHPVEIEVAHAERTVGPVEVFALPAHPPQLRPDDRLLGSAAAVLLHGRHRHRAAVARLRGRTCRSGA